MQNYFFIRRNKIGIRIYNNSCSVSTCRWTDHYHDHVNNDNFHQSAFLGFPSLLKRGRKRKKKTLFYLLYKKKVSLSFSLFLSLMVLYESDLLWFLSNHVCPHVFMSLIQPKTCDCLAVAFVSNLCKVGSHNQPMPCHCNNALIASSCHLCNYVKALPSFQRSIPHSFCIAFGSIDTCMLESLLEGFSHTKYFLPLC